MGRAALASLVAMLAAAGGLPSQLSAEELRLDMDAAVSTELNDNPRLLAGDAESVVGQVAEAGLEAGWGAEDWRWTFAPRIVARRYTGDYELDSRDIYLTGAYRRGTERDEYEATASYTRDHTLTSDFSAAGVVDDNVPRERAGLSASLNHVFTERVAAFGQAGYERVTYANGLRYGLYDYEYLSGLAYSRYVLTARTAARALLRLGRLGVPDTGARSTEVSVGLGFDHAWNERWKISLDAGPTYSTYDPGPRLKPFFGTDSGTGVSYKAELTGARPRSQVGFGAERLLSPVAGQGRLQRRDTVRASYVYRFSESLDASTWVAEDLYTDVGDRQPGSGYTSGTTRAGAALNWRPSQPWIWQLSYDHTDRDADGSPQGNRISAGVRWRGQPRSTAH